MKFQRCNNGTTMQSHRPYCTIIKGKVTDFLGWIVSLDETLAHSYEPNLKCQSYEWKHPGSPHPKKMCCTQSAVKLMSIVAEWHWWGNIEPRCTSKTDGKCCLLLHGLAAPPLSSAPRENSNTWWYRTPSFCMTMKESHRYCCHEPLTPLAMGDSETSTVLAQYEFHAITISSPKWKNHCKGPVQHKRWTYACYRAVNMEHQQTWMCWWCTAPSKHLAKGDE